MTYDTFTYESIIYYIYIIPITDVVCLRFFKYLLIYRYEKVINVLDFYLNNLLHCHENVFEVYRRSLVEDSIFLVHFAQKKQNLFFLFNVISVQDCIKCTVYRSDFKFIKSV